jgi:hypothetical protein
MVVRHTHAPHAYAQCLAHLAERSYMRRTLALAQAAVSRIRATTIRVTRILDVDRGPSSRWRTAVPITAIVLLAGAVALVRTPELITFSAPAAHVASHVTPRFAPSTAATTVPAMLGGSTALAPVAAKYVERQQRPVTKSVLRSRANQDYRRTALRRADMKVRPASAPAVRLLATAAPQPSLPQNSTVLLIVQQTEYRLDDGVLWNVRAWTVVLRPASAAAPNSISRKEI